MILIVQASVGLRCLFPSPSSCVYDNKFWTCGIFFFAGIFTSISWIFQLKTFCPRFSSCLRAHPHVSISDFCLFDQTLHLTSWSDAVVMFPPFIDIPRRSTAASIFHCNSGWLSLLFARTFWLSPKSAAVLSFPSCSGHLPAAVLVLR